MVDLITTVTLNAAIDKTYTISSFKTGKINRTQSVLTEAGGKGLNVAKVLQILGVPVAATGIVGGYTGKQICSLLDKIDLSYDFIHLEEESRQCINIIDEQTKVNTEILEQGPHVNENDWEKFQIKLCQMAEKSKYIILSGSLPKGLPSESYSKLIKLIGSKCHVIVDSSGPALAQAIGESPYLIKPNEKEMADLLDKDRLDESAIIEAFKKIDIPVFIVSLGERGALASIHGDLYKIAVPKISALNPVGSGDAFLAGITAGLYKGLSVTDSLLLAGASGAANALEKRSGFVRLKTIEALKNEIKIVKIGN